MLDPVVTNGDGQSCLWHVPAPSTRITCSENAAELKLASHMQAQAPTTSAGPDNDTPTEYDSDSGLGSPAPRKQLLKGKAHDVLDSLQSKDTHTPSQGHPDAQQDISFEPTETGVDSLLQHVKVINLDKSKGPVKKQHIDHSQDVNAFFSPMTKKNGKNKAEGKSVSIVNEASTLCQHMQAKHKAKYLKWATANKFISMLPEDSQQHWAEVALSSQPNLDAHVISREQVLCYSESAF
ncbi:hypothetical protein EV401DRAFT_1886338 [Pisolithus croceorrhizus]|nr:hypothetical protein EV401DRAFT_1886338 [Pisolithus croceorrhizus]